MIKEIIFIIGLVFLCLNTLRYTFSNIKMIKLGRYTIYSKIWNIIETVGIAIVLTILIINYYSL